MAVSLIQNTTRYQGLSTDSKPISGVERGSSFFEEDTGFEYRFTGSAWVAQTAEVRLVSAAGDVLYNKAICSSNQTTTLLGAGGSWTGNWVDTSNYSMASISINTDQNSAVNGFEIQLSNDGINIVHTHTFTIYSNSPNGHHYASGLELKYYRLKYTNRATPQTIFKLYSTLFARMVEESHVHGLDYQVKDDHPAQVVRNVNMAKQPNGAYTNIGATTGGNLKIALEELNGTSQEDLKLYIAGTGDNGSVTLTDANTAYTVPTVAPTGSYRISLYNGSDTSIYIGYENTNANGVELPPGDTGEDDLGANQQLYAYCGSAGKVITYTLKEVIA